MEFVELDSSVGSLSPQHAVLGYVTRKIGRLYGKGGDQSLAQLAPTYATMGEDAKHLSKVVKGQLQEYDMPIVTANALIVGDWWSCFWCMLGCLSGYTIANDIHPQIVNNVRWIIALLG